MSTVGEERYVDLKKICDQVEPELFDILSWILLLNLDLVPKDDININLNTKFSYSLMHQDYDEARKIANEFSKGDSTLANNYKQLLDKDPKLAKTIEISETFFALAKRRIELIEKLG
ncbi:MAG: hypothetical protein GPJ51_05535, partial [Candidatus Heimdallarchaeota archaeon]|nr:hypothetical protein [Candidatus Heimdallarchaeota archaeon]